MNEAKPTFFRQKWVWGLLGVIFSIFRQKWVWGLLGVIFSIVVVAGFLTNSWLDFEGRGSTTPNDLNDLIVDYPTGLSYKSDEPQIVELTRGITNTVKPVVVMVELGEGIVLSPTTTYIGDQFEVIFPIDIQQKAFHIQNDLHEKGTFWHWSSSGAITFTVTQPAQIQQQPEPASINIKVQTAWGHAINQFLTNNINKNSPIYIVLAALIGFGSWLWQDQKEQAKRKRQADQKKAKKNISNARQQLIRGNLDAVRNVLQNKDVEHFATSEYLSLKQIYDAIQNKEFEQLLSGPSGLEERLAAALIFIEKFDFNNIEKLEFIRKFRDANAQPLKNEGKLCRKLKEAENKYKLPEAGTRYPWKDFILDDVVGEVRAEREQKFLYKNGKFWSEHPVYKKLRKKYPLVVVGKSGSGKTAQGLALAKMPDRSIFPVYISSLSQDCNSIDKYVAYQISTKLLEFIIENATVVSKWNKMEQRLFIRHINTYVSIDSIEVNLEMALKKKHLPKTEKFVRENAEIFLLNQLKTVVSEVRSLPLSRFKPYEWLDNFEWILYDIGFSYIYFVVDISFGEKFSGMIQQLLEIAELWKTHRIITKLFIPEEYQMFLDESSVLPVESLVWDEEQLRKMIDYRSDAVDLSSDYDFSDCTTPAEAIQKYRQLKKTD